MRRSLVALLLVAAVVAVAAWWLSRDAQEAKGRAVAVARVVDGDTIVLRDGRRVRLVQIDAPELDEHECYAQESREELEALLGRAGEVELEFDPRVRVDARGPGGEPLDRFGRLLAYVLRDGENVNVALVRRGAAAPWFFAGARGRHAEELEDAAEAARRARRGAWGACPAARLDPERAWVTGRGR